MAFLTMHPPQQTRWRGLPVAHIPAEERFFVLANLAPAKQVLTPEILNFITALDIPGAQHLHHAKQLSVKEGMLLSREEVGERLMQQMGIDEEGERLANAFVRQMLDEASPNAHRVVTGFYEMERVPLPFLDALVDYDRLRLVILPQGMFVSLMKGNDYDPFWWSPQQHAAWMHGAATAWGLHVMLACIWRDACVVKREFVTDRQRAAGPSQGNKKAAKRGPLILPRVVRYVAWASDLERERIVRTTHAVRGHYRELREGWKPSEQSSENAERYGFPPPPSGFTFVQPHLRGQGAVLPDEPVSRIICKGLQVARIALG